MKITKKIGMILLAAFLILTGVNPLLNLRIEGTIMAILAIAAGALILLDR